MVLVWEKRKRKKKYLQGNFINMEVIGTVQQGKCGIDKWKN